MVIPPILIQFAVAKKQKDNKASKTPFDHFDKPSKDSLYGVKLPKNIDLNKLALEFLKIGYKYNAMGSELSNKIVHQIGNEKRSQFTAICFMCAINDI